MVLWILDRERLRAIADTLNQSLPHGRRAHAPFRLSDEGNYLECHVEVVAGPEIVKIVLSEDDNYINLHFPGSRVACIPRGQLLNKGN